MLLPQLSLDGDWCYEIPNILSTSNKSKIKNVLYLTHMARIYNLNYSPVKVGPVSHTHSSLRCNMGSHCQLPPASEAAPVFSNTRTTSRNVQGCILRVSALMYGSCGALVTQKQCIWRFYLFLVAVQREFANLKVYLLKALLQGNIILKWLIIEKVIKCMLEM